MKEQDAAHSFDKEFYKVQFVERYIKLRENLNLVDAMRHLYNEVVAPVDDELTRLRSELQQKNEVIRELIPIAQWKLRSITDNLYDLKITKEDDPDKFAEVKRLQSLIEKAKQNN